MKAIGFTFAILIVIIGWLIPSVLFITHIGIFHNYAIFFVTAYWDIVSFFASCHLAIKFLKWFESNLK